MAFTILIILGFIMYWGTMKDSQTVARITLRVAAVKAVQASGIDADDINTQFDALKVK